MLRFTRLPRRRQNRRGVASFEMVMSFPILMFLCAMLYSVYMASMLKSQVTMQVRHEAWLPRTNLNAAAGRPFSIPQAHRSGESKIERTQNVAVYRNWYPNVPRRVTWGNVVLTGSWDHRQVEFRDSTISTPHFDVLTRMVTAQGGVQTNQNVGQLQGMFNIPLN